MLQNTTPEKCRSLVELMPRCLEAVVSNKGNQFVGLKLIIECMQIPI